MTVRPGSVERAVRAELRRLSASVQNDGVAATSVRLARLLDGAETLAGASSAARELRLALEGLRHGQIIVDPRPAPATEARDPIDELGARRQRDEAARGG